MRRYSIVEDDEYSVFLVKNLFILTFDKKQHDWKLTLKTGEVLEISCFGLNVERTIVVYFLNAQYTHAHIHRDVDYSIYSHPTRSDMVVWVHYRCLLVLREWFQNTLIIKNNAEQNTTTLL